MWGLWDTLPTGVSTTSDGHRLATETYALRPGEAVFGFGEQFGRLEKSGQTIDLNMVEATGTTTPRAYKNVPFFWTTRGYGVFWHTTARATAWVGKPRRRRPPGRHRGRPSRPVRLRRGPQDDPRPLHDPHRQGPRAAPMVLRLVAVEDQLHAPPRKPSTSSTATATSGLPIDVLHLDTHWFAEDWRCDLEFDAERFPDPDAFLRQMADLGVKVSLWQLPYIPEGSALFDELEAAGGFVGHPDGGLYDIGLCYTPGLRRARRLHRLHQPRRRSPCTNATSAASTTSARPPSRPTSVRKRPSTACTTTAPPVTSPTTSTRCSTTERWPKPLTTPPGSGSSGRAPPGPEASATPFTGVGTPAPTGTTSARSSRPVCPLEPAASASGARTSAASSALIKSVATCSCAGSKPDSWSPTARIHGVGARELDTLPPDTLDAIRPALELRYQLLPYLTGEASRSSDAGLPMARPLVIEFPDDPTTWPIDDQWLLGEHLLVAPHFDPSGRRRVYLPEGRWLDWWTDDIVEGNRWITVQSPIDQIPLWIRDGGVIALGPAMEHVDQRPTDRLTLRGLAPAPGRSSTGRIGLPDRTEAWTLGPRPSGRSRRHPCRPTPPPVKSSARIPGRGVVSADISAGTRRRFVDPAPLGGCDRTGELLEVLERREECLEQTALKRMHRRVATVGDITQDVDA